MPASSLKIVYYAKFYRSTGEESNIARAFERAGCEVTRLNDKEHSADSCIEVLREVRPDLFLVAWPSRRFLIQIVEANKVSIEAGQGELYKASASWTADLMCEPATADGQNYPTIGVINSRARIAWGREACRLLDLVYLCDLHSLHLFPGARHLNFAAHDEYDRSAKPLQKLACDVAHVGSLYGPRETWANELRERYGSKKFRCFDRYFGRQLSQQIASTKVIVCPDYPVAPGYWSNRIYVLAAHGACMVHPRTPGLEMDGWIPWVHYVPYEGREEMYRAIDWALAWPNHRKRISEAAQRLVEGRHTYDHRVETIIRDVREKMETVSAKN